MKAKQVTARRRINDDIDSYQFNSLSALADACEEEGNINLAIAYRFMANKNIWPHSHPEHRWTWRTDSSENAKTFSGYSYLIPPSVHMLLSASKLANPFHRISDAFFALATAIVASGLLEQTTVVEPGQKIV